MSICVFSSFYQTRVPSCVQWTHDGTLDSGTLSTEELTDSLMLLRLINVTLAVEDASSNLVADFDVCVEKSVADSSAAA